jgi:O-succinylhomoserine sulfhydrylase
LLQRPLEFGADVVVYSATKHIDGQGRTLGGAILGSQKFFDDHLQNFLRHTGPSLSPFNAWVLVKGLETLDLRVQRHCDNALALARHLEGLSGITRVLYPGLDSHPQAALARRQMDGGSSIVAFEVTGGQARAFRLLNALELVDISNNLGDSKSLITHPSTTTHQRISAPERAELGITEGLLRISVGLEDVEDVKDDLTQALTA